jgi:Type IX secretion system protein PorV
MRIAYILTLLLLVLVIDSNAQSLTTGQEVRYNPISTAVPFLTITPDSRSGAMGDAGAATSVDVNAQHSNPSKYAFATDQWGLGVSYTPWLRQLTGDVNLAYLSGFYRLDSKQSIGASLRYFNMGRIGMTDQAGVSTGAAYPSEFALDGSYSLKLSDNFSGGVALRYIRSDLSGGFGGSLIGQENRSAGNAVATDVSFYYHNRLGAEGSPNSIAAGVNLSNIGSKISYNQGSTKEFLPANMRIGTTFTTQLNDSNSLALSLDLNKLLVPTPANIIMTAADGSKIIMPNNNSSKSVISSIFSSFGDAPGGLSEELKEFTLSLGAEYLYQKQFALRTGYFNESKMKGNRKYFTFGVGLKLQLASIDVSYVVPVDHNNPLANTVRFSLLFNTDSFTRKKKDDDASKL